MSSKLDEILDQVLEERAQDLQDAGLDVEEFRAVAKGAFVATFEGMARVMFAKGGQDGQED